MPAIGKITLDIKDYEAKLAQARKQGEAAARNAEKNANTAAKGVNKFGQSVGKAGTMVSAFGSAAGGAFGKLGSVISSFTGGRMAALTAGFGALISIGVAAWDKLTLSAEEYAAKTEMAANRADKAQAKLTQQHTEDSGYMARLQELADKERLSNDSKIEAANLIKMLTSRYGDLGVSIDAVTGKITGADEAQQKMLKRMAQQQIKATERQVESYRKKAKSQAGMMAEEYVPNLMGLRSVAQFFGGDVTMGGKDQLRKFMDTAPIEKQIEAFEELRDSMNTKADMENVQAVIDSLEKRIELETRLKNLRESGSATEKEKAARLQQNAQASQKREDFMTNEDFNTKYQDLINKGLTEQAERLKLINELKKQGIKIDETAGSFSEKQIRENIAALQAQKVKDAKPDTYWAKNEQGELQQYTRKSEAQIKNEELDKKIAAWQGVLDDRKSQGMMSQQDIDKVQQQRSEVKKGAFMAAEKESLQIQQLIIQGRTEEAKALKLILELKKQGVKIEKEEAEEIIKKRQEVASESYYKDSIKDLENQIQIQGLILEGKTEEAKRQQIINELKKRGLKYDEASVNRIMELNRQLGALNLRNSQKKEAESLYDRALRMAGRTKEADQSAALQRARDIKGSDLTKAEEKNTLAMVELTHSIQDLSRAFGLTGDLSIRTNDLTRRGGFQSGAAVPNISRFELLSLERMQQINAMLRDIRQKMNQFKGTF